MALWKTCCFYANQSGVITEHLAIVRNNAKEREEKGRDSANSPHFPDCLGWPPWSLPSPVSLNSPPLGL